MVPGAAQLVAICPIATSSSPGARSIFQIGLECVGFRSEQTSLSVSNSWSGGDGELDEVPAVSDPAHLVQIGRNHRVLTGEGQRRVALQ